MFATNVKERLSRHSLKMLLLCVALGLLAVALFSGKSRIDLEAIAVSSDEQYIACFETGNGHKIRCFHADGSIAFIYDIPVDISSGGHCTVWFENDTLCALFYRTGKIVSFSLNGTILGISPDATEESHPEFLSFAKNGHQYIFDGKEIDVIYNKRNLVEYWFFGAERYLAIKSESGEMKIIDSWNAKEGIVEE